MCLGVPGQVIELDAAGATATVRVAGAERVVNAGLLDELQSGDWVVVHLGFALARLQPDEARTALALLEVE